MLAENYKIFKKRVFLEFMRYKAALSRIIFRFYVPISKVIPNALSNR